MSLIHTQQAAEWVASAMDADRIATAPALAEVAA